MGGLPKLSEGVAVSDCLDAERCYEYEAGDYAECGGTEVAWGGGGDAEETDGDEPLPRRVVCEEAGHGGF